MSTANFVPETWDRTGDDARKTLASTGRVRLAGDAFRRLRAADGFSHARSLAFVSALAILQGVIAVVGLASDLGNGSASDLIVRTLREASPGPAGRILTQAVDQAHRAGASNRHVALIVGLVGAIISGATFMGQLERGMNRLYGIERDRPTARKYGRALLLAITAGALATAAFTAIALGGSVSSSIGSHTAARVWDWIRWPLGLVLMIAAVAMLFRWAPRRRQPDWSWLALSAMGSVLLWILVTVLLGIFLDHSSTFGQTYGPLAGMVALLLWSLLSSIALLYGAAAGAQLEAVRAGVPSPTGAGRSGNESSERVDRPRVA